MDIPGTPKEPAIWEKVSESLDANYNIYRVYKRQARHPHDGRQGTFYVMEAPDWVQVLAMTPEKKLLMVQQYRHGAHRLSWEVPGGCIDPGEEPLPAGLRELREETGYEGENARIIGAAMPNPAIQTNFTHFVLVENCKPACERALDPNEEINFTEMSVDEAVRRAQAGEIYHALTLNALFYLQAELQS